MIEYVSPETLKPAPRFDERPEPDNGLDADVAANGVLVPLLVHKGKVVDGVRRLRAAQKANLDRVPIHVNLNLQEAISLLGPVAKAEGAFAIPMWPTRQFALIPIYEYLMYLGRRARYAGGEGGRAKLRVANQIHDRLIISDGMISQLRFIVDRCTDQTIQPEMMQEILDHLYDGRLTSVGAKYRLQRSRFPGTVSTPDEQRSLLRRMITSLETAVRVFDDMALPALTQEEMAVYGQEMYAVMSRLGVIRRRLAGKETRLAENRRASNRRN